MAPLVASFSRAFFKVCSQMPRTVCGAVVKATISEWAAAAAFSCQAADGMSAAEPALAFRRACDSCLQQAALVRSLLLYSGTRHLQSSQLESKLQPVYLVYVSENEGGMQTRRLWGIA